MHERYCYTKTFATNDHLTGFSNRFTTAYPTLNTTLFYVIRRTLSSLVLWSLLFDQAIPFSRLSETYCFMPCGGPSDLMHFAYSPAVIIILFFLIVLNFSPWRKKVHEPIRITQGICR